MARWVSRWASCVCWALPAIIVAVGAVPLRGPTAGAPQRRTLKHQDGEPSGTGSAGAGQAENAAVNAYSDGCAQRLAAAEEAHQTSPEQQTLPKCGTNLDDIDYTMQEIRDVFDDAYDVCCRSQNGEKCGADPDQGGGQGMLPLETCESARCKVAVARVERACKDAFAHDAFLAMVWVPSLSPAVDLCQVTPVPAETHAKGHTTGCPDPAASNFDPAAVIANDASGEAIRALAATAGDPGRVFSGFAGDNRLCRYDCSTMSAFFKLEEDTTQCFVAGGGPCDRWPPPMNIAWDPTIPRNSRGYLVPTGAGIKSAIVQGRSMLPSPASGGATGPSRGGDAPLATTELDRRLDAIGEGVTLVIRHVTMSGLVAVAQTHSCMYDSCRTGGAVFVYKGNLIAEFCTFRGNSGPQGGGAIYTREAASTLITDCVFQDNKAIDDAEKPADLVVASGGAIAQVYTKDSAIIRSTFKDNSANRGGAIFVGTAQPFLTLSVQDCSGSGNGVTRPAIPTLADPKGCAVFWFGAGDECFADSDLSLAPDHTRPPPPPPRPPGPPAPSLALCGSHESPRCAGWASFSLSSKRAKTCEMQLPPGSMAQPGTCAPPNAPADLLPDMSLFESLKPPQGSATLLGVDVGGQCKLACRTGVAMLGQPELVCRPSSKAGGEDVSLATWHGACVI